MIFSVLCESLSFVFSPAHSLVHRVDARLLDCPGDSVWIVWARWCAEGFK